jgi:Flp pilus assembly CpaF family ATPase
VLQSGVEMPYRAIKRNIADSLNIIVQIERRPGMRCVSEVLEIQAYDSETDRYDLHPVYLNHPTPGFGDGLVNSYLSRS